MYPCDAACKTVRLVEIFIDLSQAQIRHTREKTCEARFFIASELIGFVRLAFLRKIPCSASYTSQMRWLFVGEA